MSDLYRHDIEDGESPEAYMRMKWLTHHRYLVPVEPADRAWFCSYTLPNRWSGFDYACNPNNPLMGERLLSFREVVGQVAV